MTLLETINSLEIPNFRKKQIIHAVYKEFCSDLSETTTLPKQMVAELSDLPVRSLKPVRNLVSKDKKTIKWSFLTSKGSPIETVLMLHDNGRKTLCVSCQSGCPVNCSFCWTGAMGFKQNLAADEIIEQLLIANSWLRTNFGKDVTVNRVVYMGMGEPMINLLEVTKSIEMMLDPELFGLGLRSLTVSTSGYVPMMKKFWGQYPKIGVAISLHAPTQALREQLMPVAKQFSLDSLMEVCREIQKGSKRRITYEYILIDSVTDTEECALALSELIGDQLAHVNAIPYNPIDGRDFKRPSRNRVMKFCNRLRELGISVTPRVTMGDDIKAACGQLSNHD